MKIRHKDHGEVEGVNAFYDRRSQIGWVKDGAVRFIADGWSEVPETRLVDVTGEVRIDGDGKRLTVRSREGYDYSYRLPSDMTFKLVDRYDLPKDWNGFVGSILLQELNSLSGKAASIEQAQERIGIFIEKYAKPCLTIEKEEPCP